jgi:hypothetical protein
MKRILLSVTAIILLSSYSPCFAQPPIERFFSINNTYWRFLGSQPAIDQAGLGFADNTIYLCENIIGAFGGLYCTPFTNSEMSEYGFLSLFTGDNSLYDENSITIKGGAIRLLGFGRVTLCFFGETWCVPMPIRLVDNNWSLGY